ncbi:MAG: FeoA family protein [Bdellovibrionia bacterium]
MSLTATLKHVGHVRLGKLEKGEKGLITQIGGIEFSVETVQRLMEMGFLEGATIEVLHQSPFGGDPIVVRVRGSLVALRRNEANAIEVLLDE